MVEDLKTLLEGKAICIKNKQYFSTASYVNPFLDRLKIYNPEYQCWVKSPDSITLSDNKLDMCYTRICIHAILPDNQVIGMSYGLDLKIPVVKFYKGLIDPKTGNFYSFCTNSLQIQEIEPETPFNYSWLDTILSIPDNSSKMIEQIKFCKLDRPIISYLGKWIDFIIDNSFTNEFGKVKLTVTSPVEMYQLLLKKKDSEFYHEEEVDITLLDIYYTFLSLIRDDDKDFINKFEKTILINRLLGL